LRALVAGGAVFCCRSVSGAVPAFETLEDLTIMTGTGWMLEINMDGSGRLSFGSSVTDAAVVPSGTFNPKAFYKAVAATLRVESSGAKTVAVALRAAGQRSVTALYSPKLAEIKELFATALKAGRPMEKESFAKLVQDVPFLRETEIEK
jgi:hypothetical protein